MNTTIFQAEIDDADLELFKSFLEKLQVKYKILREEKDDTKMSKEEFYQMIDKASKDEGKKASKEQLINMLFD